MAARVKCGAKDWPRKHCKADAKFRITVTGPRLGHAPRANNRRQIILRCTEHRSDLPHRAVVVTTEVL